MKNINKSTSIIGAVLVSGLIGAALGILFAPSKGKETRNKIRNKSNDIADQFKVKLHCALEGVKNELEAATDRANNFMRIEKALNSKILKITLKIQDQYPELYQFIEEMPITIPQDANPEITLKNLKAYYDSLCTMMNNYIAGHTKSVA